MKKFKITLVLAAFALSIVVSACQKGINDDDPPSDPRPSITFKADPQYTFSDGEFIAEDEILIGIVAVSNTITKKKLVKFTLLQDYSSNKSAVVDTNFSDDVFNADYYIILSNAGNYKFTARIADEDNNSAETSFEISVDEKPVPTGNVKKKVNILLGSFNDTTASFYSAVNEQVYKANEAAANQAAIDFIFWKDTRVFDNCLVSPNNSNILTVTAYGLQNWTIKNQTRFSRMEITAAEFDAIGENHDFPEFDEEMAASIASVLEHDRVVFFRTDAGKLGYVKIVDLLSRGDRALVEVIVER